MDAKRIRARARESLAGNWGIAIAVALAAFFLGGMMIGSQFFPEIRNEWDISHLDSWEDLKSLAPDRTSYRVGNINTIGLVGFILGGVIQLGYAQYLLKQYDRMPTEFSDLFSQFHRFGQGFAQNFLRGLYCFLWSLLLIIPGIVKAYSYAMTPFIMADQPEMSAQDAIRASSELMDGHKGELFWLRLTFIGWDLLAALTLNIGHLVLNPYKNAAEAAFYRELTGTTRTANTYAEYE